MGRQSKKFIVAALLHIAMTVLAAVPASAAVWHLVSPRPTPETIRACVYSSSTGSYVAVGDRGTVLTSGNGSAWQARSSNTTQVLSSVATDGTRLVAVGGTGTVLVSTDGVSWSSHTISGGGTLSDVIWDGSQFVAVKMNTSVWTSSNGESWTMKTIPSFEEGGFYPKAIAFDGSTYIAVGPDGSIWTSPDLTDWTARTSPNTYYSHNSVAAHSGTIVIVGEGSVILRSVDGGVNWSTAALAGNQADLQDVYHDGSRFVVVGHDTAWSIYGRLYTSSDGDSWTDALDQIAEQTDKNFWGVCGNAGNSVVVGAGGIVETSSNGSDWSKRTPDLDHLRSITKNSSIFVAVGDNGAVFTSDNGADWVERDSGTANRLNSVTYASGISKFITVGENGTILSSTNGITWFSETSGTATYLVSVAASETTIVASGQAGFILTSSDGGTWENRSISGESRELNVRYLGGRFVAVTYNGPAYASDDGISWTKGDVAQMAKAWNIAGSDVGWDGTTYTNGFYRSGNGVNWTSCTQKVSFRIYGITHDGNQFIAVGASGQYATSPDGDTWTSGTAIASVNLNSSQRLGSSTVIVGDHGAIFFNSTVVVAESGGTTGVTEDGAVDTYTVALASPPSSEVNVGINISAGSSDISLNGTTSLTLIFTAENWNTPQTVTISAVDDSYAEGAHTATITHTIASPDANYDGITAPSVTVNITDNDYLLTYIAGINGSITGDTSQTVIQGGDGSQVIAVPATGYNFLNWSDGSTTNPRTDTNVSADITVTASFMVNTYTVTFNTNGGSAVSSVYADHGSTISEPTAPTRTGYTFAGWYKEEGLATAWDFGSDTVTVATTLYAKWSINTYTVTFTTNGGSAVSSVYPDHGSTISEPTAPTRTGYTFGGWYKESDLTNVWDFGSDTVTSHFTLYAKWTVVTYTVTFNLAGGARTSGGELSQIINHGEDAVAPVFTAPTGKAFTGWSTPLDNITAVTSITALYDENTYSVTFDLAGGTRTGGGALIQAIAQGQAAVAPVFTAPLGKTFTGWSGSFDNIATDTTVTAQYALNQYPVTFNSNGGSMVNSVNADHGTTITAPTTPTRTGHTFGGWYKESGLINAWNFGTDAVTTNITLYAKWTASAVNTYAVSATAGPGGGIDPAVTAVNHGESAAFTITVNAGYQIASVSGCGGSLTGNTYTTGPVAADCTVTASFSLVHTQPALPTGDLNNDGAIDIVDALKALRIAAGIISPTSDDEARGDVAPLVNGIPQPDGNIGIGDVVVILRKSVGLVSW